MIKRKYIKRGMATDLAEAMLSDFQSEWYIPYIKDEFIESQVIKVNDK
jgi:hypothetical protein